MNFSMQLAVVAVAACLCLAEGAPDSRLGRTKQQRPTRGFKNVEMMTARGFGKRDRSSTRPERDVEHQHSTGRTNRDTPTFKSPSVGIARDFGKRTPEEEETDRVIPEYKPKSKLRVAIGFGKRGGDDVADEEIDNQKFKSRAFLMVSPDFGQRNGKSDDNVDQEDEQIRQTRSEFKPHSNILIARGYGKRKTDNGEVYGMENFWEMLDSSSEREGQEGTDEKALESIPVEWFVNEMLNNPEFARAAVRKFIDLNQDGMLTSEELLRNVV